MNKETSAAIIKEMAKRERIKKIRERLNNAKPAERFSDIHAIIGSGNHLCTAVVAEDEDCGELDFIADIYPEYVQEDEGNPKTYFQISAETHIARLKFLENVFSDMDYLLSLLEAS